MGTILNPYPNYKKPPKTKRYCLVCEKKYNIHI